MSKENEIVERIAPNVAGIWTFTESQGLGQDNRDIDPTLNDIIENPLKGDVLIEQKGFFITFRHLETSIYRPELKNRVGVWKPILNLDGKIQGWELWISDYDDSTSTIVQVTEFSKCGRYPLQLTYHALESGFSTSNPLQTPFVARAILNRKYLLTRE